MGTLKLYIASSLDGFIAGPKHELEWLDEFGQEGEDYEYAQMVQKVDYALMGKRTFEVVEKLSPDWPYPDFTTYVYSTKQEAVDIPQVNILKGDAAKEIQSVKDQYAGPGWLVGGGTADGKLSSCRAD